HVLRAANCPLKIFCVTKHSPKSLGTAGSFLLVEIRRKYFFDQLLQQFERAAFFVTRVTQTRFSNDKFFATTPNLIKRVLDKFLLKTIDRRVNATDSLQRKAGTAAVFAHAAHISIALFSDYYEP